MSVESSIVAMKRSLYVELKRNAKRRNIYIDLSIEEFVEYLNEDCYYCGTKPSNRVRSQRNDGLSLDYQGLDRLDPKKGYIRDNIVSCCNTCNKAKQLLTEDEFYEHIAKIVRRQWLATNPDHI